MLSSYAILLLSLQASTCNLKSPSPILLGVSFVETCHQYTQTIPTFYAFEQRENYFANYFFKKILK